MNNLSKLLFLCGLISIIPSKAIAATYSFTGSAFTQAQGSYTTSMSISGSFSTSSPLPANMALTSIGPSGSGLVTSWSFSDGINTFNSSNSIELYENGAFFSVGTDSNGQINNFRIGLMSPLPPHTLNQAMNAIFISTQTGSEEATSAQPCEAITANTCTSFDILGTNHASVSSTGAWTRINDSSSASPIPTLSIWGIALLSVLFGIIEIRRQKSANQAR